MDPLSITTGTLALLGVCVNVCVQLRKIMVGAGEARARVGGLLSDVDNLRHVLQAMEATLDDLESRDLFQNTGHIGAHWQSLCRSLQDGRDTLTSLEEMLILLNKDVSVLDSTRRYLRMREASEKIADCRQHVQSYRDAIQFSLQTVTLWNTALVHGQTTDLGPKVEEVDRKVHELSDNLEVKLQALTVLVSAHGGDKEAGALDRLKDTVRSAATVLSAASTIIDECEIPADSICSNASIPSWEPDEQFYQWMATTVESTTAGPIDVERRPSSSLHHLNDVASTTMSRTQPQNSKLRPHTGQFEDNAVPDEHTSIPAVTAVPTLTVQHEDNTFENHTVSADQERVGSPQTPHEDDLFRAVTILPDHSKKRSLGAKLSGHTRSSSAPSSINDKTSFASSKVEKSRFWKRPRAVSQESVTAPQSGLRVHEPRSSATLSATSTASEDYDGFRLAELYSQARISMNMADLPLPTSIRGKMCIKAVYVGDGACGKTCSIISFSKGTFPEVYVPTVFEKYVADVSMDGVDFEVGLWDTAGQEDYDPIRPLSYPDANVIMICFAIDQPDGISNLYEKWFAEVSRFCENVPRVLVGMKSDLRTDPHTIGLLMRDGRKPVTTEEGTQAARKLGCFAYYECSAKTGEGIHGLWEMSLRCLIQLWGGKATVQANRKKTRTLRSWLFHRA